MKRILVLYYTQTGQQLSILQSLVKPLIQHGNEVHFEQLKPVEDYAFPWTAYRFFNAFPETFNQQPLALRPLSGKAFENYDLIVLGYTPWFLTPSRPISSFMQSDDAKRIFTNKPVVTILGCRNMWLGAQEKMKHRLLQVGASLKGHIALVDRSGNLVSLVTILRWMLGGKKNAFWFFPPAGVNANEIEETVKFGEVISAALNNNNFDSLQDQLNDRGAIEVQPSLILMEKRGQKGFSVWSKFIASGGTLYSTGRKIRVYTFLYVLVPAIFILSPLLWILSRTMLVVKRKQLLAEVAYYKQNGLR